MKNIFGFIINSNLFVSFCILSLTISSEILIRTANHNISIFVFFSSIFTYNFQRIVRIKKEETHPKTIWIKEHLQLIYTILLLSCSIAIYYFFQLQNSTKSTILIAGIISVLYPFGLRKIPFIKIFIISLIWTISTMLLLIIENNVGISQSTILHLIARFLFVFAITIPFDIRDLAHDQKSLKTIPIVLGVAKSKLVAILALFITEILYIYLYFQHQLEYHFLFAIIAVLFVASILIIQSNKKQTDYYYSFWVESLSILFYLSLSLAVFYLYLS